LEPLVVLHGFPTSSFDFVHVVDGLAEHRRVLLLDMIGYGLSAKPDRAYTIDLQADVAQAFVADTGVSRLALLTHDLGDTVGGELLARQAEGRWPVEITRRVLTNGSIYIEMAKLSAGQELLLSLPDERLPDSAGIDRPAMEASLAATFSARSPLEESDLHGASELILHDDGHLLLPRTIRYIEERRRNQARFTGAIETHRSPVTIVWGTDDPIAVAPMATRLQGVRPDAALTWMPDVGHYPMLESPSAFLDAVVPALS
jgi:pimeloyl-ACP methyl ester carboxylesterase